MSSILEIIKHDSTPIIIFGVGVVGEAIYQRCLEKGIDIECFCDNAKYKTSSTMFGKKIIHADDLKANYPDAIFLIAVCDIKDIVDQLMIMGYKKWHDCSLFIENIDINNYDFNGTNDFVDFAINTCISCHESYSNADKLFLRSVDIIITERCSMKCQDCSNLMQYYDAPVNEDINIILNSINDLCSYVDEINEFRIIGGEPFMNKEFHWVVKRLIDEPKVKRIVIYTNGTIVPKDHQIDYLTHTKVILLITDYNELSRNMDKLINVLTENNVYFHKRPAEGWTDCSSMVRHNRTVQEQQEIFQSCCAKNLITLSNGKLYRCPFSANADRLHSVPEHDNDFIDISQQKRQGISSSKMRKHIRHFLLEKTRLNICDYCNGRPLGAPEIIPAIQTRKPLGYIKHVDYVS